MSKYFASETYGNCVVALWNGPPQRDQLNLLTELCEGTARQNGDEVLLVAIVAEGSPIISAEQREMVEDFYVGLNDHLLAVAQIVEGRTLWSATARSVLTAMTIVKRRKYPLRVFASLEEAGDWLTDYLEGPAADEDERLEGLRDALKAARSTVDLPS